MPPVRPPARPSLRSVRGLIFNQGFISVLRNYSRLLSTIRGKATTILRKQTFPGLSPDCLGDLLGSQITLKQNEYRSSVGHGKSSSAGERFTRKCRTIMKHHRFYRVTGSVFVLGLSLLVLGIFFLSAIEQPVAALTPLAPVGQIAPAAADAIQLIGAYSGQVQLQAVTTGVFSATLATPTPTPAGTALDLGAIDLALQLNQSGNLVSGYVDLSKTLIFSVEHTLAGPPALAIGPYVTGSFDGATLRLTSETVHQAVMGRTITRQFSLVGATDPGDSGSLVGEYRETLWGYAGQPITTIGAFTLKRPQFSAASQTTANKAPITTADSAMTASGLPVTINVLDNDADDDGDPLTITTVGTPQHGAVTTNGQSITYTPAPAFVGVDTFTYFVSDGKGATTAGTVTVVVEEGKTTSNMLYLPLIRR